jgi:Mg2+ and Co2+ transporter CorA
LSFKNSTQAPGQYSVGTGGQYSFGANTLPINIIAGLFGMNVGGIPLSENPLGFWIIVAIIATFTCFAGWYAFFKQRD